MFQTVHRFVVEGAFETDVDERGAELLGEEPSRLDGAVDGAIELVHHPLAVWTCDRLAPRLLALDQPSTSRS